jgi:hypothetical protein
MLQSGFQETPINVCDVQDKDRLRKHRELRKKWLAWLQADPNHPIWSQLFKIVVNDLAVRTLSAAAENDPQSPLHNPLLVRTILEGHQDAQILGIRRLWDNDTKVISVRRLLKDIRANLDAVTREIYVSGNGLPYNPSSEIVIASLTGPGFVSPSSPILSSLQTEKAQQRFDRLSKISADRRARSDRIPKALIDHLEKHIAKSGADDIVKWSHQFVAHAGDSEGRGWRDPDATFEKGISAQKSIAQVVPLTSTQLLQGPSFGNLVPVQPSPFRRLDRLVSPQALEKASRLWDDLEKDRNSWLQNDWGGPDLLTVVGW